jgi:hypothetical protein
MQSSNFCRASIEVTGRRRKLFLIWCASPPRPGAILRAIIVTWKALASPQNPLCYRTFPKRKLENGPPNQNLPAADPRWTEAVAAATRPFSLSPCGAPAPVEPSYHRRDVSEHAVLGEVPGATGYEVQVSQNGDFSTAPIVATSSDPSATSHVDNTITNGVKRWYRVRSTAGTTNQPNAVKGRWTAPVISTSGSGTTTYDQVTHSTMWRRGQTVPLGIGQATPAWLAGQTPPLGFGPRRIRT